MEASLTIVLIIVIIIVVGIVIWLLLSINDNKPPSPNTVPNRGNLNDLCNQDHDCKSAYACQEGYCKAKLGTHCVTVNECISSATACTKDTRVCTNTTLPEEGQPCTSLPCASGFTCVGEICSSNTRPNTTVGLNQPCSLPDRPCQSGLICDSNSGSVCRVNTGDLCTSANDCIHGDRCGYQYDADGNEIGSSVCIPLVDNFKHCIVDEQCASGRCGSSSLLAYIPDNVKRLEAELIDSYLVDGRLVPVQRVSDRSILDVISEGPNLLMLLEDGTILREVYSPKGHNFLETIHSDHIMQRLSLLGGVTTGGPNTSIIYGVSSNILYELDKRRSSNNYWVWNKVLWARGTAAPLHINHISHSHDGNFLWIQYRLLAGSTHLSTHRKYHRRGGYNGHHYEPYGDQDSDTDDDVDETRSYNDVSAAIRSSRYCIKNSGDSRLQWGALYQYTGPNSEPDLLERIIVSDNIIRSYGLNDLSYLEVDLDTRQALRYPQGNTISNFYVGTLLSDGSVFKLGVEFIERVRNVVYTRGLAHIITYRLCRPKRYSREQSIDIALDEEDLLDDSRSLRYQIVRAR